MITDEWPQESQEFIEVFGEVILTALRDYQAELGPITAHTQEKRAINEGIRKYQCFQGPDGEKAIVTCAAIPGVIYYRDFCDFSQRLPDFDYSLPTPEFLDRYHLTE